MSFHEKKTPDRVQFHSQREEGDLSPDDDK